MRNYPALCARIASRLPVEAALERCWRARVIPGLCLTLARRARASSPLHNARLCLFPATDRRLQASAASNTPAQLRPHRRRSSVNFSDPGRPSRRHRVASSFCSLALEMEPVEHASAVWPEGQEYLRPIVATRASPFFASCPVLCPSNADRRPNGSPSLHDLQSTSSSSGCSRSSSPVDGARGTTCGGCR